MTLDMTAEDSAAALRIFGRNASEFLSNTVGTVLGVVNIALAAWNLVTTTDPLQKDMDALNIVSASLGILGIAAGWIAASVDISIDLGTVGTILCMETAAAWLGPLSVAFAVGMSFSYRHSVETSLSMLPPHPAGIIVMIGSLSFRQYCLSSIDHVPSSDDDQTSNPTGPNQDFCSESSQGRWPVYAAIDCD
jgi:hypothetical protein